MPLSNIISYISLVVAVISFIYAKRAYDRDKSDLRMRVKFYPETYQGRALWIELTNHGRRPAQFEHPFLILDRKEMLTPTLYPPTLRFPMALQEGDTETLQIPFGYNTKLDNPCRIKNVLIQTTTGKTYAAPHADRKKFRKAIAERFKPAVGWTDD